MDAGSSAALDLAALVPAAAEAGLALGHDELVVLDRFAAALVEGNARANLTRLASPREIALGHVLDSLWILRALPPGLALPEARLSAVDVGTGAGLPGLVLAIVRPGWRLVLADAVGKKVAFAQQVITDLGLGAATAIQARAEDLGRDPTHREAYDLALARAVAPLAVLAEYLLPLVRVGGLALAMKGADVAEELAAAEAAIERLGGRLTRVVPYTLPHLDAPRHLVVLSKETPTPPAFPRRAGLPARRPIRL